jgi:hypothetical protein
MGAAAVEATTEDLCYVVLAGLLTRWNGLYWKKYVRMNMNYQANCELKIMLERKKSLLYFVSTPAFSFTI